MTNWGSILGDVLKTYANSQVPQTPADVQNVPHDQVYDHYKQFTQQAPPQQVYDAHQQAYQQIPQDQKSSIFNALLGALAQHGVSPQQAGIQGNDPTPENIAQANRYISQRPDLLDSIFGQGGALSSPLAKMVLAGALAVAASKFSQGGNNKDFNKGSMI